MFKRVLALTLVFVMAVGVVGCTGTSDIPEYAEKQFEISGFWAPYDISEEGLKQYKDAGFTTLAMINHSLEYTSEGQFYLGSDRTMTALENCKKVGLKAILNYNDWMVPRCEEEGEDFYGDTPFSKYDIYGEYKDIITGIHICDEPYLKREDGTGTNHFELYGKKTTIDDFKKDYPNAKFIVNLIPITAVGTRGFDSYDEMMDLYEKTFMEPFGNKAFVSVDVYPFHNGNTNDDGTLQIEASEDGKTLTVQLVAPCAYFLDLCAFPAFYPVPEQAVQGVQPICTLFGYRPEKHPYKGSGPGLLYPQDVARI